VKADLLLALRELVKDHHQAWVVELLGAKASGVSEEALEALLADGLLAVEDVEGILIPGSRYQLNPYLFVTAMARVMAGTGDRADMRTWSLDKWVGVVDLEIDKWMEVATVTGEGFLVEPGAPGIRVELGDKPSVPEDPPARIPVSPDVPEWASQAEAHAYTQARARAGAYARGLGNIVWDELHNALTESWAGEEIVDQVDPEKRAESLQTIEDLTAEAVISHRDSGQLATELARAHNDWTHNWERIARTELQGAYNDGQLLAGIENYGPEARIARFPETGACSYCRAHFLDAAGRPRVFPIQESMDNGTNVGKRRAEWVPTIWPMHPNCRCDTISVPPGMFVTSDGRLRMERSRE